MLEDHDQCIRQRRLGRYAEAVSTGGRGGSGGKHQPWPAPAAGAHR